MATIQGVIHGKTIELERESGLPEGQRVAVEVCPLDERPDSLPDDEVVVCQEDADPARVHPPVVAPQRPTVPGGCHRDRVGGSPPERIG